MSATLSKAEQKLQDVVEYAKEKVLGPAGLAPSQTKVRSIYAEPVDPASEPRSSSATESASGKPPRPTINKTLVWLGPKKVGLQDRPFPTMHNNKGVAVEHGVILKVVATNICGSDLHMYRGTFGGVTPGMALGHEISGEIVEMGSDVESWQLGDIVSVPFNVACGKCTNCREQKTNACLKCAGKLGAGAAYGFPMMGDWTGGQSEYHFVPYADFQLLRLPKDRAISKMAQGLAFLSDIFPTGYNAAVQAGVKVGSIVYCAGAGPVGLCAAQSALLMGAACVFISDHKADRLKLAEQIGCHTIDLTKLSGGSSDSEAIMAEISKRLPPEKNGDHQLVDCSIDCVGYECCGCGRESSKRVSEQVLNTCMMVTKAGGGIGVPGIYPVMDPTGANSDNKQGIFHLNYGLSWNKGQSLGQGQCPVMAHNEWLMKVILHDRVDLGKLLNVKIISLEEAPEAYKAFNEGEAAKYIIDPHGMIRGGAGGGGGI